MALASYKAVYFFVYENGYVTLEATDARSIALGAGWIGYINTANIAKVKQGVNDPTWTTETPTGSGPTTYLSLGGGG